MKKQLKPDTEELIIKMHQQLISLERKMDTLISRPQDRPVGNNQRHQGHGEARQGRDHRERTLYKAVCADCKNECEVPFRPSQDRPVYCKECFSKRKTVGVFKASRENRGRESEPAQERTLDKHQGAENRKPIRKKPAAKRRKK